MRYKQYDFQVRDRVFSVGTHVMGILNVTGDSFFAPSRVDCDFVARAEKMIKNGAEIIDIGGQSTAPNATKIGSLEEMSRVLPAIKAIRDANIDIPISVDTFYSDVAESAIEIGADMINDVSCLSDGNMASVVARYGVAICVSHDRRSSKNKDLFFDKELGLSKAISTLKKAGVEDSKIMLDGGIGFNKNSDEDWALLNDYDKLISTFSDYPFLLGTSRKSMFGGDVSSRLTATLDSTISAVKMGVLFVRVHDIAENKAIIECYSR